MKMSAAEACRIVGLPDGFSLTTPGFIRVAMERWKAETVRARSEGKDAEAAALSQAHEVLKKAARKLCECGEAKRASAPRCNTCRMKQGITVPIEDAISDDLEIPPILRAGTLREKLGRLEKIGDSIVVKTKCTPKNFGVVFISRPAGKNGYRRIWRTDGKAAEEVNQIIRDRKHENQNRSSD